MMAAVNGAAVDFVGNGDGTLHAECSPDGQLGPYDSSSADPSEHRQRPKSVLSGEEDETECGGGASRRPAAFKRPSSAVSPTLDSISGSSMASSTFQERSSKKRRKQRNPVRLSTRMCDAEGIVVEYVDDAASPEGIVDAPAERAAATESEPAGSPPRDGFEEGSVYRCLHCNVLFESEEQLRDHVEDEHVQKALEQQLQQQNQKNLFTLSAATGLIGLNPFDLSSPLPRADCPNSTSSSSDHSAQDIKPDLERLNSVLQQQCQQQQQHAMASLSPAAAAAAVAAFQNSKDVANLMALSAFGAAPFLIPIVPSPVMASGVSGAPRLAQATPPGGTATTGGGGSPPNAPPIRIFNPEAFCELCNKEFCNKYFLKTHKANKHGVYSLDTLTTGAAVTSSGTMPIPQTSAPFTGLVRPMLQGSPGLSENALGGGGGIIGQSANGGAVSNSSNIIVATSLVNSLANGGGMVTGSGGGGLILGPSSLLSKGLPTVMNLDAFCDICQKEFCNKYFLRKHRQKIHGIQEPQATSAFNLVTPTSSSPTMAAHMDSAASVSASSDLHGAMSAHLASSSSSSHAPLPSSSSLDLYFEFGVRDLSAKIAAATALMQAPPPKHSIQSLVASSTTGMNASPTSTASGHSFPSEQSKMSAAIVPGSVMVAGHVFSPDRLREMGVINLDAFCEICCKEFCNKYFLRTHKMNKHGIGTAGCLDMPGVSSGGGGGAHKGMSSQQLAPLSLVVDKDVMLEEGRKCVTPNSSSSSSNSSSSSSSSSSSGCGVIGGGGGEVLQHRPVTSADGHRPPSASRGDSVAVELICEVCSRPFSSAYLLKMHKFYFHNIGDLSSVMPPSGGDLTDLKLEPISTSFNKTSSSSPDNANGRCGSGSGRGSVEIMDPVVADAGSGEAILTSSTPGGAPPLNEDLQKLQTMIRELNTSPKDGTAKCNICFREMKNKYFLRAHVMNEHGELHNEEDILGTECGVKREVAAAVVERDAVIVSSMSASGATAVPTATAKNIVSSGYDPESFCNVCGKEFCSKYFLRTHKINVHGVGDGGLDKPPVESPTNLAKGSGDAVAMSTPLPVPLDKIKTENQQLPLMSTIICTTSSSYMPPAPLVSHHAHIHQHLSPVSCQPPLSALERTPPSSSVTGRNFCEICNKELCNKYFMKTHMLKMHGINVDEKSFVNGATIGGVTCDICQKELCSKYFLKVHKQNTHGIFEEQPVLNKDSYMSVSLGVLPDKDGHHGQYHHHPGEVDGGISASSSNRYFSHYTEVCPLCERRFKSIKWLKTHIVNDHADLAKDTGFSDIVGEFLYTAGACEPVHASVLRAHHFALSPTDVMVSGTKGDKMSSTSSSSAATSPNATSPFSHLPHQATHHHHQHHHQQHPGHQDIDSGTGTGGTASHHAGELGSTGVAAALAGGSASSATVTPTSSSVVSSPGHHVAKPVLGSSSVLAPGIPGRKPLMSGNGTRIYHCSYCSYSTRWLSNLYAHEKRHTGLSSEGEKRFSCRVCHRAYRYNHSLQRHLVSHKTSGFLLKHFASNQGLLMSHEHMARAPAHHHQQQQQQQQLNHQNAVMNPNDMFAATSQNHSSSPRSSAMDLTGHLRMFPDGDDEEEEDEEEYEEERRRLKLRKEESARAATTARLPTHSGAHGSAAPGKVTQPARVKKYRCSKCGAKYRSREQCLEHIHLHHNTRSRHHHHGGAAVASAKGDTAAPAGAAPTTSPAPSAQQPPLIHHCPRCPFADNSREAVLDHLARHHFNEGGNEQEFEPQLDVEDGLSLHRDVSTPGGRPQMPMTYAVPQAPPSAGSFIMQPFLMSQPEAGEGDLAAAAVESSNSPPSNTFVPSLVYLPVSHKVTDPVTVAFNLTPA